MWFLNLFETQVLSFGSMKQLRNLFYLLEDIRVEQSTYWYWKTPKALLTDVISWKRKLNYSNQCSYEKARGFWSWKNCTHFKWTVSDARMIRLVVKRKVCSFQLEDLIKSLIIGEDCGVDSPFMQNLHHSENFGSLLWVCIRAYLVPFCHTCLQQQEEWQA